VACQNGFHGRTVGALSLMQRPDYREPFGPLLADVSFIPFGDGDALEAELRRGDVAGFIVEPIQCEGGIIVPPAGYLRGVRALCTRYGTLFIADEVQTGLGRTGALFAVDHEGVAPDVLLLGKALGGGVVPISALLTTEVIYKAAQGDTARSPFHMPTFGGNPLSCAVGIATLNILHHERLVERAAAAGTYLVERLRELQRTQPFIADVRGRGLAIGVEFDPAAGGLARTLGGEHIARLAHTYFAGFVIMQLINQHHIITLNTLHNQNVLRLEPPLIVEREQLDGAVAALDHILRETKSFTRVALHNAPRLVRAMLA
jgi:putrescine aminotransferase